MKLSIDTNIYTLMKKGDPEVVSLLETADELLVPSVVLGELYSGFYRGKHEKKNINELDEFLSKPGVTVVDIDRDIAERYGLIIRALKKQGTPIPTNDIWIASVVLHTGSKLATRDRHFSHVPGLIIV